MHSYTIDLPADDDFDAWRDAARRLLLAKAAPDDVLWHSPDMPPQQSLFGDKSSALPELAADAPPMLVPHAFVTLAKTVILHRNPARFDILYRLLDLAVRDGRIMADSAHPLIRRATVMAKEVRRDIHKMRAFVRFRLADERDPDPLYVAWFEPEHHIVRANAAFFLGRFAAMRWSILTPALTLHWDGTTLSEAPGLSRMDAPQWDAAEDLWRGYYAATFNPARLKVKAMTKEMPRKYWKNLPEAKIIPDLIASAQSREAAMLAASPQDAGETPRSWADLHAGIEACQRCPIGCNGTRPVLGEGPLAAPLMIIGEQPGDVEEEKGRPFVGPAGQLLDDALAMAGIDRAQAYLTNGVKHFKFELRDGPRGKKRLHKTPSPREIDICRWWLGAEINLVKPQIIVTLGASALRAVTGRTLKMKDVRGRRQALEGGGAYLPTVHPSYLLRLPDPARRLEEERQFVADLRDAGRMLAALS